MLFGCKKISSRMEDINVFASWCRRTNNKGIAAGNDKRKITWWLNSFRGITLMMFFMFSFPLPLSVKTHVDFVLMSFWLYRQPRISPLCCFDQCLVIWVNNDWLASARISISFFNVLFLSICRLTDHRQEKRVMPFVLPFLLSWWLWWKRKTRYERKIIRNHAEVLSFTIEFSCRFPLVFLSFSSEKMSLCVPRVYFLYGHFKLSFILCTSSFSYCFSFFTALFLFFEWVKQEVVIRHHDQLHSGHHLETWSLLHQILEW